MANRSRRAGPLAGVDESNKLIVSEQNENQTKASTEGEITVIVCFSQSYKVHYFCYIAKIIKIDRVNIHFIVYTSDNQSKKFKVTWSRGINLFLPAKSQRRCFVAWPFSSSQASTFSSKYAIESVTLETTIARMKIEEMRMLSIAMSIQFHSDWR